MAENEVGDATKIWHYTDLPAFIAALQNKQLCFKRLVEQLSDPLEGRADPPSDRRYWQRLEESIRNGWCHCWSIDESESDLMWARVAKRLRFAVAIESTVGRLSQCFLGRVSDAYVETDFVKIFRGKVAYGRQRQSPLLPKYIFHKRSTFHGEYEYRLYISIEGGADRNDEVKFVDIDRAVLFENIWVSPDSQDWEMQGIQRLIKKYGLVDINVRRREIEAT